MLSYLFQRRSLFHQTLVASAAIVLLITFVFLDTCFGAAYAPLSMTFWGLVFLLVFEPAPPFCLLVLVSCLQDVLQAYPLGASASVNFALTLFLFPWKEGLLKRSPVRAALSLVLLHIAFVMFHFGLLSLLGRHLVLPSFPTATTCLAVLVDLFAGWKLWQVCTSGRIS